MNMNKKYGIFGLVLVVILATVLISGCIDDENNNKEFTKAITVEGVTFFVPNDFNLENTQDNGINKETTYSDGINSITIFFYPNASKESLLSQMKSLATFSNIQEDVTIGGISGHTAEGPVTKIFVFEKGGETFAIELSENLNFEEYVTKIIK
ncbi:MAG: hypothetical protein FWH29_03015 [Methanobrevibacter sp.]|nr:hypothetical protein [Methanobrevibacter sp.]